MVKRIIQKYSGFIRSLKIVYFLNNLFSTNKLKHNKDLYKKYGLQKSIYSSLGTKDFKIRSSEIPWIDKIDAIDKFNTMQGFNTLPKEIQNQIKSFITDGYMILKSYFTKEEIEKHNGIIARLKSQDQIDFNYTNRKINQVHKHSEFIEKKFFKNEGLLQLFKYLLGEEIIPFHTIHFLEGSEQKAHSDSIHMSTEPEGYLIAAWIALEATDENNGPLFYYPGSHKLPYLSCLDYESGNNNWLIGGKYSRYEDKVEEIVASKTFEKKYFHAEPGDVLIWHANLLHGGDPIKKQGRTRKSMVSHYFCKDVICYHEITQRPALIDSQP
jgi:hypothetical protein